jgi:hypothetical protein
MVVDHHCNGVGVHAFVAVNCRAEVARAAHSDTPRRLPGTSSASCLGNVCMVRSAPDKIVMLRNGKPKPISSCASK